MQIIIYHDPFEVKFYFRLEDAPTIGDVLRYEECNYRIINIKRNLPTNTRYEYNEIEITARFTKDLD